MSGTEQMEWHQTPGNHVFDVFDSVLLIPLQSLPQARSTQLRYRQTPVMPTTPENTFPYYPDSPEWR